MKGSSTTLRVVRAAAFAFVVWAIFFGLQPAASAVLSVRSPAHPMRLLGTDLLLALTWAMLSVAIAGWHRRVRLVSRNVLSAAALHLPFVVLAIVVDTMVSRIAAIFIEHAPTLAPFAPSAIYYADLDVASYIGIVVIAEAFLLREALLEQQRLAKRLESSLGRARLDYLESQLQPHFLFNSLGAVSELAYDAPHAASRVLGQLTAVFRTALARRGDEVTVGEEIVGLEPYLDIQRIRFADWLTIAYQVDDAAVDCLLPRFVLQPLVENAIRHGLSGRLAAGTLEISAGVDAGSLYVRVTDNGIGLVPSPARGGHGIGLSNVRDRLAILYGDDDRLRLTANASGGTVAELRVPIRWRGDARLATATTEGTAAIAPTRLELPSLHLPAALARPWLATLVVWLVCGVLWAQQSYTYLALRGRLAGRSWLDVAYSDMTSALIWALLTPLVLFFARRLPLRRPMFGGRIALYVIAGVTTTVLHVVALQRTVLRDIPLTSSAWQINLMVGFVIFAAIAALAHRRLLIGWVRAREAAAAVLTTELAVVQSRARQLQGIPYVLLQSLDGIARTVLRDPSLTERQITRLADYLRVALEATDARGLTTERARALDGALSALRESGAYPVDLTLSA